MWAGLGVHDRTEWVFMMDQNGCSPSAEYALISSFLTPNVSKKVTWLDWNTRKKALALVADISLGIFLAMSLMSMQLWVIVDLAGPIITMVVVQFVIAAIIALFIIFRIMGSNYDAAVICFGLVVFH